MTLIEFARKLREVFKFKYLTLENYRGEGPEFLGLWTEKPEYSEISEMWVSHHCCLFANFDTGDLAVDLDLSEYKDENGEIDYSHCIVEVE